jgi:DNA-binding transcriptional MerR regulator
VGYTAAQAARLSRCTVSQLRYWSRSGLVSASEASRYSFRDLVALRVVRSLLDAGLSSTRVHAAVRWVRESGDDLADLRLVTDGRTVWVCHDDGQILDALRAGQLALFVAVDSLAAEVDAEVRIFDAERAEFVEHLTDTGSTDTGSTASGGATASGAGGASEPTG